MKPYISKLMRQAHEFGDPLMRTLFYEYPHDQNAWNIEDTYLFGDAILVAPIENYKETSREVYLPKGESWTNLWTRENFDGGKTVVVEADIQQIPILSKQVKKVNFQNYLM